MTRLFGEGVTAAVRRDPVLWAVTLLVALVHLGFAGRYDVFRNELYFIICGRHPAFGYVDQPPLIPLLAAATQLFGESVWLLRLPAALAAVALVPLTAAMARALGGTRTAAWIAGLAAGLSPMLAALTTVLTTASLEPLAWTGLTYCVLRAVQGGDRRFLYGAGLVAGLAMAAKYGAAIWIIVLGIGLIATPARRLFRQPGLWGAGLLAVAIGAPSLVWQALNGWPFFDVIRPAVGGTNFTGSPVHFMIGQAFEQNILLAPLWLAGIAAPFWLPRLKSARFVAIAYVVAAAIVIGAHGKNYYLAGAYPSLFAVGAVAAEPIARMLRLGWMAMACALTVPLAPVVFPILDPPVLARYLAATHLAPPPEEAAAVGAPLTQLFSDQLGWRTLEQQVAAVYRALPEDERAHTALVAADYGEAAALDFYGMADGLPPALSGQN
ncbi:MAG TPA: glycosyltransferase family 39 protein [Aliidongia sp.]|uniref:glycosyltransferase family 39 protein n=1 Tax=Aliidongia sp. TaxID=1914230 RepID=UPI002DDCB963|nr:glycosyltransferase family 39 protein [Aliidongia sp.]HEV2673828.1 glycosyltransferase family 39 protein [Aliidongia sp.]